MARRSKIEGLPPDVRRWLEQALTEHGFGGYDALAELLAGKGFVISKSAIHRYGQKIERRFAAIKASTEAARLIAEGAGDDQAVRSDALVAMTETALFEAMIEISEATSEEIRPADRMAMFSKAAKNVASLVGGSVRLKRFQQEERDKAEAGA